jgi:hypothetical protein
MPGFVCTKSLCSVYLEQDGLHCSCSGFDSCLIALEETIHTDGCVHVLTIRCPHMDFSSGKSLETRHALVWKKKIGMLLSGFCLKKVCTWLNVPSLGTGRWFGRGNSHRWVRSCFDYLCDGDGSMLHILEITGTLKIKIFILFIIYIYLLLLVILFICYFQNGS